MKKIRLHFMFKSFKVRVTMALILSMLFVGALSNFCVYKFTLGAQFSQLRDKLKMIAQTAALMVDADKLVQVPLNRNGATSPQYIAIAERLKAVKEANRPIRFIYTMAKTDQQGILQFIVDPDLVGTQKKKGITAYPGDKYNAARFPDLLNAFNGATSDSKLSLDEWGAGLSGYAPIKDKDGKVVAILGVDITAADVYNTQKSVRLRAIFVLLLGVVLSVILGILVSNRITGPLKKLLDGTRHISMGNLDYKVDVSGDDEISELADSFNKMIVSLYDSRRRIHNYFYSVIQSFARIVDARDKYTQGHSERVAEYSEKISRKLGFKQEDTELLKETALLHDIGKLGVQESILNKKEKLTEQDWEIIRKHPTIGEDILSPVLTQKEMLAAVRQHHERFDGKGYPNHISGKDIHIFAQVLSVADSYDAMTSSRAYRPALSKEKAIEEIKKNSGTQFNPKIVDAFLQVLSEEK